MVANAFLIDNRASRQILTGYLTGTYGKLLLEAKEVFSPSIEEGLKSLLGMKEGVVFFPNGVRAVEHPCQNCSTQRLIGEGRLLRTGVTIQGFRWPEDHPVQGVLLGLPLATAMVDLHGNECVDLSPLVEEFMVRQVSEGVGITPPCAYIRVVTTTAGHVPRVSHRLFGPSLLPEELRAASTSTASVSALA